MDQADQIAVEIIVKGRNVEIPEHYRQHVSDKISRLERYDHKLIRFDVELFHEPNRRQSQACQRVEITAKTRGPVVRAEACAKDFYSALDQAVAKLEGRLRRAADRRRVHHGRRTPISVAAATAKLALVGAPIGDGVSYSHNGHNFNGNSLNGSGLVADGVPESVNGFDAKTDFVDWDQADDHQPGHIAREKEHSAKPMTVDQALFEMELVGHDFYLFSNVDTGRPSVVYRRHGYDYGVISLAA